MPPFLQPFSAATLAAMLLALAAVSRADEGARQGFPEDSPEHQALQAAAPHLAGDVLQLRRDYWSGALSSDTGRAVRLQFFKGNVYRLFLGAEPAGMPEGARLQLHIVDENSEVVAASGASPGAPVAELHFEEVPKTGLYLVLMSVDPGPGPLAAFEVPAVLFYGWE